MFHLPSSVFVSAGRYGQYLFSSVVLGMGAAGYLLLHGGRGKRLVLVSLGVIAVAVLFCGSRGPLILSVVSAGVMSLAFLWGAPWRNRQVYRVLKATRHSVIVMGMCLALAALILPEEVGKRWNFYSETLSPSSSAYELTHRTWDYPLHEFMLAFSGSHWAVGNGTGTASLGVQYVSKLLGERPPQVSRRERLRITPSRIWNRWPDSLVDMGYGTGDQLLARRPETSSDPDVSSRIRSVLVCIRTSVSRDIRLN